jgi:uncharacterized protein
MHNFTPISALSGGLLLGLGATVLFASLGRFAGISGIWGGVLQPTRGDLSWRVAFIGGLVAAGALMSRLMPLSLGDSPRTGWGVVAAGVLVGVGARLANGCTSGHGVCGLSRFSLRSLAATLAFMTTGAVAASVARLAGAWR